MIDTLRRVELAKALWGWNPHPTQRQWLLIDARVKTAACGRRWGKTEAAAVDAATMAITRPGSVQIIVAPTYDQSSLIFDTVERLMMGSRITRAISKVTRTPYPRLVVGRSILMARTADEDGESARSCGGQGDRRRGRLRAGLRDPGSDRPHARRPKRPPGDGRHAIRQEPFLPVLLERDGRRATSSLSWGRGSG